MDELITIFNATAAAGIALALSWAVLSHRVRDGVVIKLGLICMALGFGALSWHLVDGLGCMDLHAISRAHALVHLGLGVVLVGLLVRAARGHGLRDLVYLDDLP